MRQYKQLEIRIHGNRKISSAIDIVRGCEGAVRRDKGCYHSCYAAKLARMSGTDFSKPIINTLNRIKLKNDLEHNKSSWMRIGTNGDPSLAWNTAVQVCEMCHTSNKIPVIMTKAWTKPTLSQLKKLAKAEAHIQIGLSALDTDEELKERFSLLRRYNNRYTAGTIAKVMTLPWVPYQMQAKQDDLVKVAQIYRFMELPLRVFKSNPRADEFNWTKLRKHWNGVSQRLDNQWTAGPLYAPKTFKENLQANKAGTYYLCGEVTCDTCPHMCATEACPMPLAGLIVSQ